ncbi:MAG: hypothetical protein Q9162_002943 [Coniocarpon cinnabarinum]
MSLKNDAIPSSEAFDVIHQSLTSDPKEQEQAIKQGGAVFAFTLKNGNTTDSWHIDLKKSGTVGKGLVTADGTKAQVTLQLSDADFKKLIEGKGNAQQMFMSGKLKVKGDVMKATKLDPILKRAQSSPQAKAKL